MKKSGRVVRVNLTALADVHQDYIFRLPYPMTDEEIEEYVRNHAGDHIWQYDGARDDTIEVTIEKEEDDDETL